MDASKSVPIPFLTLKAKTLKFRNSLNTLLLYHYRVFSHDVTAAILVSQNNETAAMLVSQTGPVGVELFSYANAFFCSNRFAYMLATWVKTLYNKCSRTRLIFYRVSPARLSHLASLRIQPRGGGGVLGLNFAWHVPLACQGPYPIIVYSGGNYRPRLRHFWTNM